MDRPIVFLIHSYFGGLLRYQRLREHLEKEWRVVLVDAQMSGRTWPPSRDIPDLARRASQQILHAEPDGPFTLVGHSAGGLIALEVARALESRHMRVSYLGLVDSPRIGSLADFVWSEGIQNAPELARLLATGSLGAALRARLRRSSGPRTRIGDTISAVNRNTNVAVRSHRADPYAGPAVVFRTKEGARMSHWRRNLGWSDVIAQIELLDVPGGHVTSLDEPHVATLARLLTESIQSRITTPSRTARP